jgi:restriction system protein
MARDPGSFGSYREWEAARRAEQRANEQAARAKEQQRKARERQRALEEAVARDKEAATRTKAVSQRVAELEALLRSSLTRDPQVSFASLRRRAVVPPLDLGELAVGTQGPQWTDFIPEAPRGLRRMFGGQQRYEAAVEAAGQAFRQAEADHKIREANRRSQIADARHAHERKVAQAEREVAAHNAHVDEIAAGLGNRDRYTVSEYVQIVLDRSPYPADFPAERKAGYVPESSLLAVEWYLPPVEVIPEQKVFRHVKTRKVIEPTARPLAEIRKVYQTVIAQIALRTLREVFDSTSEELISTVVFNGRVHAIDPLTGQKIRPHLITLRATREQFTPLAAARRGDQPGPAVLPCLWAGQGAGADDPGLAVLRRRGAGAGPHLMDRGAGCGAPGP